MMGNEDEFEQDKDKRQIELRKLLAKELSVEAGRIVQGISSGEIELTVPTVLEIVRLHIYSPSVKSFLVQLTLRIGDNPRLFFNVTSKDGETSRLSIPLDI